MSSLFAVSRITLGILEMPKQVVLWCSSLLYLQPRSHSFMHLIIVPPFNFRTTTLGGLSASVKMFFSYAAAVMISCRIAGGSELTNSGRQVGTESVQHASATYSGGL